MFVLKKLFQLRDQANPDSEKPFLDHLNDLRITVTRLIVTLFVATIICYIYHNQLMDIIRLPVETTWNKSQGHALRDLNPRPSLKAWETSIKAANAAIGLSPEQREAFIEASSNGDPDFVFHMESAFYYRTVLTLPEGAKRIEYIKKLPGITEQMRSQLRGLLKGNPNADLDSKGRMVVMQSLNPTEGFMLSVKLSFIAGIIISFPLLLYFLLQFILPGLHDHEKQAFFPALGIGFLLFLGGVLFAYFIILPNVLDFFYKYSLEMGIQNDWRIGYYISFATQFVLIFGVAFELPVVVMALVKIGILNHDMMKGSRAYAVLAITIIAAVITPTPDAFTLSLLAVPMYILYEICIWLAYFHDKKEMAKEAAEEKERLERLLSAPSLAPAIGTQARLNEDDEDDYPGPDPEAEELFGQAPPDEPFENKEEERQ